MIEGVIALVAVAEDLEEEAGLGGVETEVADLIDDEEFGLGQRLDGMAKAVLGEGGAELASQFHGGDEVEAVAEFGSDDAQGDGEVGLADAGRTQEQDVATFGQEAASGEFLQQAPVDGRLEGEVEVGEALEGRAGRRSADWFR